MAIVEARFACMLMNTGDAVLSAFRATWFLGPAPTFGLARSRTESCWAENGCGGEGIDGIGGIGGCGSLTGSKVSVEGRGVLRASEVAYVDMLKREGG